MHDRDIVTMEDKWEIIYGLLNGMIAMTLSEFEGACDFFRKKRTQAPSTETGSKNSIAHLKTPDSVRRKRKHSNFERQVPAVDRNKGIDFSQVPCTEHMDQSADIALQESTRSAVNIPLLDISCGFLDLEEIASEPAEDGFHSRAVNRSTHTVEYEVRDEQNAEMATAAADVSSPADEAADEEDSDSEIVMDICLLDTPKFSIDRRSCCTTPASLVSWNLDVGDISLTQDCDLFHDDENVLPDDAELDLAEESRSTVAQDRDIQSASLQNEIILEQLEKKRGREEVNKEYTSERSMSRCDADAEDAVESDVILLSDDEKMGSVDSAAEQVSTTAESLIPGRPPQPSCTQWSLDVSSLAMGQTDDRAAEVSLYPGPQSPENNDECFQLTVPADDIEVSLEQLVPGPTAERNIRTRGQLKQQSEKSDGDAECTGIQSTTLENDTEDNRREDNLEIPAQFAFRGKKGKSLSWKRTPKEQPKTVTKEWLLEGASISDEPLSENSDDFFDFSAPWSRNDCQNRRRRGSTLSRRRRGKVNSTSAVLEVETYLEPQLPHTNAETLHDGIDNEPHAKPTRRRPKTGGQQNKQVKNAKESADQKSKADSPKQDSSINFMSSQHEFVTKTINTSEKLLAPKTSGRGRKLRAHKEQKKSTEKTVNQKAKEDSPQPNECLSLSSFQVTEAHKSIFETSLAADKPLEPKPIPRSLRTRGQMKKQTEKAEDAVHQKKPPDKPQQDTCTNELSLQEADKTHEPWTNLQTAVINTETFNYIKTGNTEKILQENDENDTREIHSAGSRSCSISNDCSVSSLHHDHYENDAASPTVQPIQHTVGDGEKDDIDCCQKSSPALSCQSEILIGSSPAESCIPRSELLSSQSLAATPATAVDNSPCSAVVDDDQEQTTDAALINVTTHTDDSLHDRDSMIPGSVYNPDYVNYEAAVSRAARRKSSVPQCIGLSCGRIVISQQSNVDYCAKTTGTDTTEAMQRLDRVMASVAACELTDRDEEPHADVDSVNSSRCTSSNVTYSEVASHNSSAIASQEFAHISPPADSLHRSQDNSSKGLSHTVLSGNGVRGTSRKMSTSNEHTYEGEDPMADYSESLHFASQRTRQQKCSVAASGFAGCFLQYRYFQSASNVHETQQQFMRDVPEAGDHAGPEVNEIPSTLPEMHPKMQTSNKSLKQVAYANNESCLTDQSEFSAAQTAASQQGCRQKCSVVASEYSFSRQATQALYATQPQVGVSCATRNTDEFPSSLLQINSQIQSSAEAACASRNNSMKDFKELSPASASQHHHKHKCSVVASEYGLGSQGVQRLQDAQQNVAAASEYSFARQAAQALYTAQQQVSVSYAARNTDKIPSSLLQIQSSADAACTSRNSSTKGFNELSSASASQQHHRHKCSVVASQYGLGSQGVQRLHDAQQKDAAADHNPPEMNAVPSSFSLTCPQGYSICTCSSVAPVETQPVVSFCTQAVDSVRAAAAATRQSNFAADDDSGGNLPNFMFPCEGMRNVDGQQSGKVADAGDGVWSMNVSQTGVGQRVKVSEPRLADSHTVTDDDKPAKESKAKTA